MKRAKSGVRLLNIHIGAWMVKFYFKLCNESLLTSCILLGGLQSLPLPYIIIGKTWKINLEFGVPLAITVFDHYCERVQFN